MQNVARFGSPVKSAASLQRTLVDIITLACRKYLQCPCKTKGRIRFVKATIEETQ